MKSIQIGINGAGDSLNKKERMIENQRFLIIEDLR